jgi:hypothetical protein
MLIHQRAGWNRSDDHDLETPWLPIRIGVFGLLLVAAALHALTAGTIGMTMLAVMT